MAIGSMSRQPMKTSYLSSFRSNDRFGFKKEHADLFSKQFYFSNEIVNPFDKTNSATELSKRR